MPSYFVTGTGTGIGKTYLTSLLAHQLHEAGHAVRALKPVETGVDQLEQTDSAALLRAVGKEVTTQHVDEITPFRYATPLAPAHAALRENKPLDIAAVEAFCTVPYDGITLIEGAGGVMVPLAEQYTTLDLMQKLRMPVILVCGTYLGAISHTLTALASLQHAGLTVTVVVNGSVDAALSLDEMAETIRRYAKNNPRIFTVGRQSSTTTDKAAPYLLEIVT